MTLTRWIPRNSLATYHNELDRFFNSFFSQDETEASVYNFSPVVDIAENEKDFHVTAELPGIDKKDVKITVKENVLTITGEKKQNDEKEEKNFHRTERIYGSFQRCFRLPRTVDNKNIKADFKNGLLEVDIPKLKEAIPEEFVISVN